MLSQSSVSGMVAIGIGDPDQLDVLSLVLSAVGIEHGLDRQGSQLIVAAGDAKTALAHLHHYHQENSDWPPPRPRNTAMAARNQPTLLLMTGIPILFVLTGNWASESIWFARGAIESEAILGHGQWWRLFTALTLHADLAHLVANCLSGGLIVHLLGKTVGYGQAWFLLLFCGGLGNLANIALRQQPHLSVGFSTAVFAAIGLLSGAQLAVATGRSWREPLLSLGAGIGLLAFLGSEGARTDLGAHLCGFLTGLGYGVLGTAFGLTGLFRRPALQGWLFAAGLIVLGASWLRAFA